MQCLVVYYSLTGNTRKVAERAARSLAADVAEIYAQRYRSGAFRTIRAVFDAWRGKLPAIEVDGAAPDNYELVLLMGPVWAGHAASPLRAYLAQSRGRLRRAAFLLTCAGSCPPRAFEEMAVAAGIKPEATLMVLDREIGSTGLPSALATFLASINASKAA
ncbi:MAG TPA: hypothetical protein VFY92_13025 [Hyphomicrobiaceae bacterium]|nr:hypothetical protein [Hyphomicrobiaceae bacterium]